MHNYQAVALDEETYTERERRRLSWRLRLGLGEPEELEDEEDRELEEPERLEPDELDPLEEPELEPELLLEEELDLVTINKKREIYEERGQIFIFNTGIKDPIKRANLLLLLPVDALRRFLAFSRPLSFSPSFVPGFSLPLSFVFSSSFRFVGEGALR